MFNGTVEEIHSFLQAKVLELTKKSEAVNRVGDEEQLASIGMDSVSTINLVIQIEQHFNITFEDEELLLDNFETIHKISENIRGKLIGAHP